MGPKILKKETKIYFRKVFALCSLNTRFDIFKVMSGVILDKKYSLQIILSPDNISLATAKSQARNVG